MGNFNAKEYIDTLIDNFNKYDYYTNDQDTIMSFKKLKKVKTNADLSSCLKELHNKNLVYQFLHQESYIHPGTKETYLDLGENLAKLLIYLDNNQGQEISKKISPTIKPSISNLSYLMLVDKTLDINSINKSISLTENTIINISVDNLYYPLMFNKNKKMFDASDYYGRFSNKEGMIEIPQVDEKFKSSTLTHESFHALDHYLFNHLKQQFPKLQTVAKEFTSFIEEIKIYEEIPEVFEIDLQEIKNDVSFNKFFEFCDSFDKIPHTYKLSKEDTKEYIEKYLKININDYIFETDFTQQVLEIYSNEKGKLSKDSLTIISDFTEDIKSLSKDIFEYYYNSNTEKSMYSIMSDLISKLASEKNNYRGSLNEKCARVFEMNSYSSNNDDIYKLLPDSISDKNIYPIGNERNFYVNYLNKELKNLSNLFNQHIFISEPIPEPRKFFKKEDITEGFNLPNSDENKFDLCEFSKSQALSNILKIRELQNSNPNIHKLKV